MHIWTIPPETRLPLLKGPVRFAVGTPASLSSNSWRVWTQGQETYVVCRDAYREIKASLHASGTWKVGFTEQAVAASPTLLPEGRDRAWKKWRPDLDDQTKLVIGLQIPFLAQSLFVKPESRSRWRPKVIFIEPPVDPQKMTVVSIGVAPTLSPAAGDPALEGGVIAVLPLGASRSVQLIAHYEDSGSLRQTILSAIPDALAALRERDLLPEDAALFLYGEKPLDIPWVTAIRLREQPGQGKDTTGERS